MRQAYGRQNMCAMMPPSHATWPATRALSNPTSLARIRRSQSELNQLSIQDVIRQWQRKPTDTGSGEVQVAVFTERILRMASHMGRHHKDKGALSLVPTHRTRRHTTTITTATSDSATATEMLTDAFEQRIGFPLTRT